MEEVTVVDAVEPLFENIKFDSKLASRLYRFQLEFVNKNKEHLEFFGGNLLGVQVIRFTDRDVNKFFDETLQLDYDYNQVSDALSKITTINQKFKVASDPFNIVTVYMIHRFLTSPDIRDTDRQRAMYDIALIFCYRTICALMNSTFTYPTDPKIAQAAYAKLSRKYLIKELGSWQKTFDYRAKDLVRKDSIHFNTFKRFNDDIAIMYIITDTQGRVRDAFKNYCKVFFETWAEKEAIGTSSATFLDLEGEETLKEKVQAVEKYVGYIRNVLTDKDTFIKQELVTVINNVNSNTSRRMLIGTLTWLVDNYGNEKYFRDIDTFVSNVVVYSFYLIGNHVPISAKRDYPKLLTSLKNLYLSTRTVDPGLLEIRDLGEKLIKASSKSNMSKSLVYSTRTALILFITLRALITDH